MPKAEEYDTEPINTAAGLVSGAFYAPMTDDGSTLDHSGLILFDGADNGGKGVKYWNVFTKFEPTMPDDAIWDYVQIRLQTFAASGLGAINQRYGMLKRDGNWDVTDGFANWVLDTDAALADIGINSDHTEDLTVYWNDLPAGQGVHIPKETTKFTNQYFGDALAGVVLPNTNTIAFPGLLAHLQSYWDNAANVAARGNGETTDGVPIAIELHTALGDGAANIEAFQSWHSSRYGSTLRPVLYLGWHNLEGAGEIDTACTLDAAGTVLRGLKAELAVAAALDAAPALTLAGAGELDSTSTLDAAGMLTVAGKSELDVVSLLDTLPTLTASAKSELTTTATLDGALTGNPLTAKSELVATATLDLLPQLVKALQVEMFVTAALDAVGTMTLAARAEIAATTTLDVNAVIFRLGTIFRVLQRITAAMPITRTSDTQVVTRIVSAQTVTRSSSPSELERPSATLTLLRPTNVVEVPEET